MKKDLKPHDVITAILSHINEEIDICNKLLIDPKKYHLEKASLMSDRHFYGLKKYTDGQFNAYTRIFYLIQSMQGCDKND